MVRGPCVIGGYELRAHLGYDPNEAAFLSGGWLRTGDKGRIDEHGHVRLTGRFKEIINRAGEKISPLAIEHAVLAATVAAPPEAAWAPAEGGQGAAGGDPHGAGPPAGRQAALGGDPAGSQAPATGELCGWVREVLAFAAPHEELGEAVGVAVVCDAGRTVSLTQIRRAASRGGMLSRQWLPEMLVILGALPRGPTGKPARIGLAEAYELPTLRLSASMRTVDLRGKQPMGHEANRRADARKAAARRSAARKAEGKLEGRVDGGEGGGRDGGSGGGIRAGGGGGGGGGADGGATADGALTMRGCLALVVEAMLEASGEAVAEDDDLFDAGLSSISAARLREELDARTGASLPHGLVYEHTTARALAAAIYRIVVPTERVADVPAASAASATTCGMADEPGGRDGASSVSAGGHAAEEDADPLVALAEAGEAVRCGDLSRAEARCLLAARAMGIDEDTWRRPPGECELGEFELSAAPLLALLTPVWGRLQRWAEASVACRALIDVRIRMERQRPGERRGRVDVAILWMVLARLRMAAGDEAAAVGAAAAADDALALAARGATGVLLPSAPGATASAIGAPATGAPAASAASSTTVPATADMAAAVSARGGDGSAAVAEVVGGASDAVGQPLGGEGGGAQPQSTPGEAGRLCMLLGDGGTLRSPPLSCASLQTLDLRNEGLVSLPPAIATLSQLRVLDASHNRLEQVDTPSLVQMGRLT